MIYSRVLSTGGFFPPGLLDNRTLSKKFDITEDWIMRVSGIETRHVVSNEVTSDLATGAAKQAIETANINPNTIDLIILATSTPDLLLPSTACKVQHNLGIKNNCPAFDINAVCTGFVYALHVADQFIKAQSSKRVLVIGADVFSNKSPSKSAETAILFGDGAGAVILDAASEPGIIYSQIHSNGEYKDIIWTSHNDAGMDGQRLFKQAVLTLGQVIVDTLDKNNYTIDDINWIVPHQANIRIINAIAKKFNVPDDKVIQTIKTHANTSAATVPLAFNEAIRDGRINRGDVILMEAFGSGLTWGSNLLRY
jgi:3-oxoacyl-[acyl-carrier-protein] synthase-3